MGSPRQWSSRLDESYSSSPSPSSIETDHPPPTSYFPRQFCRACHRPIHISGNISGECLVICISTHQTKSKWTNMLRELPEPVLIPTRVQDYTILFDDLWYDFQELKDMNENQRQRLNSRMKDRGALKSHAPLPWLLYRQHDGQSGQTRNQENYNRMWETCVKDGSRSGFPVRFLTIKKSDLAENAGRSRLSNSESRSWNLFTPTRTSSWSSNDCQSPPEPYNFSSIVHRPRDTRSHFAPTKSSIQISGAYTNPMSPPTSPDKRYSQPQGYVDIGVSDRSNTPESWDEDSVDGID